MLGIHLRNAVSAEKVSLHVSQSVYIEYLQLIGSFTWQNTHKVIESCTLKHSQIFFLKIVRDTKYFSNFRNEISVKELKITIKFNVNFLSMALKDTFPLTMSVFWKSCGLDDISLV